MTESSKHLNPFRLISTHALELSLKASDPTITKLDFNLDFKHQVAGVPDAKTDNERRTFVVQFQAEVKNTAQSVVLFTKFIVIFQCENPITSEYIESDIIQINAPAIAFPFLRSFITTVTSNAGVPPMYLPSINFIKLAKQAKGKSTLNMPERLGP